VLPVRDDLESPDLGRASHVRPAAQLAREAVHLDHPHELAVFLTEEHDRP
jgi:hypothetical protein